MKVSKRNTCRISGEPLKELFSLGEIYVSDFLTQYQTENIDDKIELTLCLAPKSGLVQLNCTADLDKMYGEQYWYHSGTNKSMRDELTDIVQSILKVIKLEDKETWLDGNGKKHLPGKDVWLDIGSNDGTLLTYVPDNFFRIGFDPSKDNCKEARKNLNENARIVDDYFNYRTFSSFVPRKAKVITSIAMFYDLENPHDFVKEVYEALDDNGVWVIQMSYLPLMLCQLAFDNICHEHLEYYNFTVLKKLLEEHGFTVVDFKINDTNGGSCRVYVQKSSCNHLNFGTAPFRDVAQFRIDSAISHEKTLQLDEIETYTKFFNRINDLKRKTVEFIHLKKSQGKKIWAYGASTKGNTLLQFFGLDNTMIDAIAERQPAKYGLKTVGTHIPIVSEDEFRKAQPDYTLVLPWHFINEFKIREKDYLDQGGHFIIPCPIFDVT